MPQAIVAVAGFIGAVFGPAAVAPIFLIGTTAIGLKLLTPIMRRALGIRDPGDFSTPVNYQLSVTGTVEPRFIVYGEAKVGGSITFRKSAGTENRSFYCEIVHTGHTIDSYVGWYVDDKYIDATDVDDINSAGDGSVDGDTASTGHGLTPVDGTPVLYLRGHLGAADQAVDSQLDSAFTEITSSHRHRGCARTNLRAELLEGAEDRWDNVSPQNVGAVIRGKLVYDPRLDSTFTGAVFGAGSGSHRLATPSTWEWSDNPALCLADYLIDSDLGPGWDTSRIDYDSVAVSADHCDEAVDIPGSTTQARFTCNGVLVTTEHYRDNIGAILASMAGALRYYGGQWHIFAGDWPGLSAGLSQSDLIGPISYRKEPERNDRYNCVRGSYFDPDRNYKESMFLEVNDTSIRTNRDNGEKIAKEVSLAMVNNEYTAQRLGFRALYQAGNTGILRFPTGYQGLNYRAGDVIPFEIDELGWASETLRVVNHRMLDFQGVELVCRRDDEPSHDDPDDTDYGTRSAAGVITFPRVRTNLQFVGESVIADPFFQRSTQMWDGTTGTHKQYFWWGGDNGTSTLSISRTGGVTGGRVLLGMGTTHILQFSSIPRNFSAFVSGERFRINLRIRKTSSVTTLGAGNLIGAGIFSMFDPPNLAPFLGGNQIVITDTDINGWTVNEWQEFEGESVPSQSAKNLTQIPYIGAQVTTAVFDVACNIEIDCINISRIAS